MKYIERRINKDKIEIVTISDWHLGDKLFDEKLAHKYIDYINNNKNVYVIGMGDLTNTALKNSKSDVYNSMSPKNEIALLTSDKFLGSIKKDKWLIYTSGNHGNRLEQETSISADSIIVDKLGIADKYAPSIGVINIQLNGNSYYIALHHGIGGGNTMGAKANRMEKFSNIIAGADIAILGHTHTPMCIPKLQYILDKKHSRIKKQITYMINSGSLLGYEEGYAERFIMHPSVVGNAIITIEKCGRRCPKRIFTRWQV